MRAMRIWALVLMAAGMLLAGCQNRNKSHSSQNEPEGFGK